MQKFQQQDQPYADIFVGQSEMAELMRRHDWAATPLGPPEHWPQALKVALRILLTSRFEMWLGWGPDVHFFYNDAYRPTLGVKHPRSLGMPTRELWAEIWDDIRDRIQGVYQRGESTWDRALLLLLERAGYPEETYHTFSYSPLIGDTGKVEGLFCAVSEETDRVINERRLGILRELASSLATADTTAAVLDATCRTLGDATRDLTFSAFYRFDEAGQAVLACAAGVQRPAELVPERLPPGHFWQPERVLAGERSYVVDLAGRAGVPLGAWDRPATQALVVPVARQGSAAPAGFLACGINPYRRLDADYTGFVQLVAGQIAASLANANDFEQRTAERDRLRALFTQAPSFFCVLDGPEHRFLLANESYRKLVGHREVEGKTIREALPEVAEQGFVDLLDQVYRARQPHVGRSVEVRLQHGPGGPLATRYVDFVFQPILDPSGACSGIFVEGSDVTDKVEAERELRGLNAHLESRIAERTRDLEQAMQRLQDETRERQAAEDALRQAQKMEAVGQLTGGIAHDFNNLLQGITGSLDLLKLRLQLGRTDNLDRLVAGAMNSAQRAAGLVHRLLAFSRRQPLDPKPVKANQLLTPMEELLRRTMGEHIRIELVLAGGLWTTLCDPNQLESAILNLAINARDAMPHGGRLTIETSNTWFDDAYAAQHQEVQAGQYVCISVTDTGEGMTPDVLAKAFEPFFTTKPIGQGTGLGLSMIYGFAKQSLGHVKLYSEPGQGTTAKLYLPRHVGEEDTPEPVPQLGDEHQSLHGEVVLVVEDEAVVRSLVIDVLVGLGYRTLEAADGAAALRILESRQRIDLLVTDVGLPVMNGRQVYDAAVTSRPGLKVLFMTGYAENATLASGFLAPGMEMITKPFSMENLARRISRILGHEAPDAPGGCEAPAAAGSDESFACKNRPTPGGGQLGDTLLLIRMAAEPSTPCPAFLRRGGALGALLRARDWTNSPFGPPTEWPATLQTLVGLMLSSSQPMFVAWGPERRLLYNDAYAAVLGRKHPAALGEDLLAVWSELRAEAEPLVEQVYRGEAVQMHDIRLVVERNGYPEETHFSFSYSPIRDGDDTIRGMFCACMETTSEVLGEQRLRESEARYRDMLARMDEAFVVLDREFRIVDINDEALRIDQRTRSQLLGQSQWTLHPGSEHTELGAFYRRVMSGGVAETLEQRLVWPDGHAAWLEIRAYPVAEGLALFFRDISARREAEERLQLALGAGAILGTWVWDVPADHFQADERFARAFGLDPEPLRQGLPLGEVRQTIHPEDQERLTQQLQKVLAAGGPYRCEYRVRREDGQYYWVEANGRVEMDAAGRPLRFPGVLLDIEERRRAEQERDRATAMLRGFIEAVPGVIYAKDPEGRFLMANRGTAELLGKPPEQFLGKTDAEILEDPQEAATVMANDRRVMASGQLEQIEEAVQRADGQSAWWLSTKAPLRDLEGRVVGLIGSSVDITERKREQELARTEAEMLDVLNRTGTLLAAELDLETLLQSVTDAATRLTGARFGAFFYNGQNEHGEAYTLYTLSGAPREAFSHFGHPRATAVFAPTFHGGPAIRLDDVTRDPRYGRSGPHHGMPKGHLQVRSYLAVSVVSRSGEVIGGLFFGHPEAGVFTERSERLATGVAAQAAIAIDNARLYAEAQRAASERKALLESERAARTEAERASNVKDEFLATLSHELRTPLSSITGWVHILRRRLDPHDATLQKGVDVIDRSTRVQVQLIEDLLDMSRVTSGKLKLDVQPVAAISFVQAAVETVRPSAHGARVELQLVEEGAVPTVLGDAARLQQVVWNLLSNAIKFTPAGGRVTVRVGTVADQVRIAVEDTGIGIPPDFLPHVFDRFRQADGSTTRRFGGLGLGLSIVRHLVELHGGTITARSEGEGRGASFEVLLPLMDAHGVERIEREHPALADDVDLAGVRVLVVDDEPDVLDLLSRVLADAGASVHAASGAAAALDAFEPADPHVLVSDIGMPEIDGYELLAKLRRVQGRNGRPVPAIALTAFARAEDRQRALNSGFEAYLSKPVQPAMLVQAVARMAGREP